MTADLFNQRLSYVIETVRTFHAQLEQFSSEAEKHGEKHFLVEKFLGAETLIALKEAVDNLRSTVWHYLESAARESSKPGVEYAVQPYRIQRVTEMLQALQPNGSQTEPQAPPERCSFFERMHTIADNAMEKHTRAGTVEQ